MDEMEQWDDVLPVGSVLRSGKREYRVEAVLGKGGFGITYKVSAMEQVGRIPVRVEFAMKEFFMDGCLRDASGKVSTAATKGEAADGLKDFISEARRLNSLCGQCRNIVPVDEVFEANGTACYVMEFLDGGSLADYVKKQGALSVGAAKKILKPVADAVAFLHSNRITHLDIKPGNIMFRSNGEPVLIDFGLAKHYDRRGNATTTVRTLAYSAGFSPAEQYVGLKQFSPQSDVYALAATFVNMLTGKTPPEAIDLEFSLNDWSVCLPEEVRPAVVHAMAYSRKDRTLSVRDFVKELYGNEPSVVEKPVSQPAAEPTVESKTKVIGEDRSRRASEKWWIIATCVAVAAVVGIVCAKFLSVSEELAQKTEPALPFVSVESNSTNGRYGENVESDIVQGDEQGDKNKSDDKIRKNEVETECEGQARLPENPAPRDKEDKVFTNVEQMPKFPGGDAELYKFISNHLNYPVMAIEDGIQGKVVVQFVVAKDGSIGKAKVVRNLSPDCDNEAIRVCKKLPKFIPGKQNGQPVNVWYTLPVTFMLKK